MLMRRALVISASLTNRPTCFSLAISALLRGAMSARADGSGDPLALMKPGRSDIGARSWDGVRLQPCRDLLSCPCDAVDRRLTLSTECVVEVVASRHRLVPLALALLEIGGEALAIRRGLLPPV